MPFVSTDPGSLMLDFRLRVLILGFRKASNAAIGRNKDLAEPLNE